MKKKQIPGAIIHHPTKCIADGCSNKQADNGENLMCEECINKCIRICTCNKKFISDKPTHYILRGVYYDDYTVTPDGILYDNDGSPKRRELPCPIPSYYYTNVAGNFYKILGCRGCQRISEISIQNDFDKALQASIEACIFQKYEEDGEIKYEYLSDALDQFFEEYLHKNGISVGESSVIVNN